MLQNATWIEARDLLLSLAKPVEEETVALDHCAGRVLAQSALCCPPCVPVAVCGEEIDGEIIERLRYYGIGTCAVVG